MGEDERELIEISSAASTDSSNELLKSDCSSMFSHDDGANNVYAISVGESDRKILQIAIR